MFAEFLLCAERRTGCSAESITDVIPAGAAVQGSRAGSSAA